MSIAADNLPLPRRDVNRKNLPRRDGLLKKAAATRRFIKKVAATHRKINLPLPRRCRDDFQKNVSNFTVATILDSKYC